MSEPEYTDTAGDPAGAVVTATRRLGGGLAVLGGVLIGLAYLLMPVATIPLAGSLTAPALLEQVPDVSSFTLLRLVPVAAVVMIGAGVWLLLGRSSAAALKVIAAVIVLSALLTALAYLIPYAQLSKQITDSGASELGISATTFTGAGFWFALIGAITAIVGAAVEFNASRKPT